MVRIAFYLNLQGAGHCRRFEAIARCFPHNCELAVIGMDGPPPTADIGLPVKKVSVPGFSPSPNCPFLQQQTAHDYHDLVVNRGENTAFVLAMVSFFNRWKPDLLVVDVGIEASIVGRLCGIPTVYSRQHGRRWDKGHTLAYEWACGLLAPFSEKMEQTDCPPWIRKKTFYSGGFCRFSGRQPAPKAPSAYVQGKSNVLVMTGFGGTDMTVEAIAHSAHQTPRWRWHLLGDHPKVSGVCSHGVVEDVWPFLCHADLVIANAGHNATMEIGAAGSPSICIPVWRHFDEQVCKADVLKQLGLSIVVDKWPRSQDWATLWKESRSLKADWSHLQDKDAPNKAAQYLFDIATKCMA